MILQGLISPDTCLHMALLEFKLIFNSLFAMFADLHIRKLATFALCACIINLAFWGIFPYDLQVKNPAS